MRRSVVGEVNYRTVLYCRPRWVGGAQMLVEVSGGAGGEGAMEFCAAQMHDEVDLLDARG